MCCAHVMNKPKSMVRLLPHNVVWQSRCALPRELCWAAMLLCSLPRNTQWRTPAVDVSGVAQSFIASKQQNISPASSHCRSLILPQRGSPPDFATLAGLNWKTKARQTCCHDEAPGHVFFGGRISTISHTALSSNWWWLQGQGIRGNTAPATTHKMMSTE